MSDDSTEENEPVTISDLGEGEGHQTEKGRFNEDGSDGSSSDTDSSDE